MHAQVDSMDFQGCGICAEECPGNAIEMQLEQQHGVCSI